MIFFSLAVSSSLSVTTSSSSFTPSLPPYIPRLSGVNEGSSHTGSETTSLQANSLVTSQVSGSKNIICSHHINMPFPWIKSFSIHQVGSGFHSSFLSNGAGSSSSSSGISSAGQTTLSHLSPQLRYAFMLRPVDILPPLLFVTPEIFRDCSGNRLFSSNPLRSQTGIKSGRSSS